MVAAVGDAFWLAGYEIIKLDRQGSILFRQPVNGWCCASVSVNPKSGDVWLVERNHPDVPNSKNRVWLLKPDGSVSQQVEFGEQNVFGIDCDPVTGDAWICAYRGDLRKVSPAGKVSELKELQAHDISINPGGQIWAKTAGALLKIDRSGQPLARFPWKDESKSAWLEAF